MQNRPRKTLGACLIAIALGGCAQPMIPPAPPPLPADLVQACPDLTPIEDGTAAAVLRKLVEASQAYYDCQARHAGLVEAVQ